VTTGNSVQSIPADSIPQRDETRNWEKEGWQPANQQPSTPNGLAVTVSVRFDPKSARLIRRAARLRGGNLSEYIRDTTVNQAYCDIEQYEKKPIDISVHRVTQSSGDSPSLTDSSTSESASVRIEAEIARGFNITARSASMELAGRF